MSQISIKSNPIFWIYTVSIVLFMAIPMWYLFQRNKAKQFLINKSEVKESQPYMTSFSPNYTIKLPGNRGNISFRNRPLKAHEYLLLGNPDTKKIIDDETYVGILQHGDKVQLLEQDGLAYKIKFKRSSDAWILTGYIAISVDGIKSIEPIR